MSTEPCKPQIKKRYVKDPYHEGQKTELHTLWCKTCRVKIGGQVASANNAGHRYAQQMVEKGWKEHVSARQLPTPAGSAVTR